MAVSRPCDQCHEVKRCRMYQRCQEHHARQSSVRPVPLWTREGQMVYLCGCCARELEYQR